VLRMASNTPTAAATLGAADGEDGTAARGARKRKTVDFFDPVANNESGKKVAGTPAAKEVSFSLARGLNRCMPSCCYLYAAKSRFARVYGAVCLLWKTSSKRCALEVLHSNHGTLPPVAITSCIEAQGMGIKLGDIPNGMPALCYCCCVQHYTFPGSVLLLQVAQVARPHQCAHGAQWLHPACSRAPPDQDPRQRRVPGAAAPGAVQAARHRELAQEGHPRLLRLDVCG